MSKSISDVGLSPRVYKILSSLGIKNIERLADWSEKDLLRTPDCGRRSLAEIKTMLARNGMTLREDYYLDEKTQAGMTLRDYFAGKAMQGLLRYPYGEDMCKPYREDVLPMDELAQYAYGQADAMLRSRK